MQHPVDSRIWSVIVNPNAGCRKGSRDWKKIESLLSSCGLLFQAQFTGARHDAIRMTREAIEKGYRKFIVVGGDGTMNEVVNGCFLQTACPTTDITLAIITVGTGNDWGRLFGIPHDYSQAIRIIKNGHLHLQDAGIVNYFNGTSKGKRYFINIAGLGFDAVVVKRTNLQKDRGRSGKAIYLWNMLRSLFLYKHTQVEVNIDGTIIRNRVFTISLGIGKYSGGGMMQTPNAITDDGLFDITLVKDMRKGEVIMNLKMLYNGTIYNHPKISGYTGRHILVDSDPLIHVEADGESLGHSPIEFEIIPKSIHVVCNPDKVL
jgi:YegS/Rv2252/BmrU family lipid kinase